MTLRRQYIKKSVENELPFREKESSVLPPFESENDNQREETIGNALEETTPIVPEIVYEAEQNSSLNTVENTFENSNIYNLPHTEVQDQLATHYIQDYIDNQYAIQHVNSVWFSDESKLTNAGSLLIFLDGASRFVTHHVYLPVDSSFTCSLVAEHLVKASSVFDSPHVIHSDQGGIFQGDALKEVCESSNITKSVGAYGCKKLKLATNGKAGKSFRNQCVERFFRTFKGILKAELKLDDGTKSFKRLSSKSVAEQQGIVRTVIQKYNNSPHSSLYFASPQLVFVALRYTQEKGLTCLPPKDEILLITKKQKANVQNNVKPNQKVVSLAEYKEGFNSCMDLRKEKLVALTQDLCESKETNQLLTIARSGTAEAGQIQKYMQMSVVKFLIDWTNEPNIQGPVIPDIVNLLYQGFSKPKEKDFYLSAVLSWLLTSQSNCIFELEKQVEKLEGNKEALLFSLTTTETKVDSLNKQVGAFEAEQEKQAEIARVKALRSHRRRNAKHRVPSAPADLIMLETAISFIDERQRVSDFVKSRDKVCLVVLFLTGMRCRNLLYLTRTNVEELLYGDMLTIPSVKNNPNNYLCPITDLQQNVALRYKADFDIVIAGLKPSDYVIRAEPKPSGEPSNTIDDKHLNKQLNGPLAKASIKLGMKFTTNSFRSAFITAWIEATDIKGAKEAVQHKQLQSTEHYDRSVVTSPQHRKRAKRVAKILLTPKNKKGKPRKNQNKGEVKPIESKTSQFEKPIDLLGDVG